MDDALRELVEDWLTKASGDSRAAERLEPADEEEGYDPALYGRAAFYRQQAAEKSLKAFLSANALAFGKTHDLERLVRLAASIDDEFRTLSDSAEHLAPFAVEIRYPGDWDELSTAEYEEIKEAAEQIVEFVTERIHEDD